jgi:GTP cyclohydrolase I
MSAPTRRDAEAAVATLLAWAAGELGAELNDDVRERTPARVVGALAELLSGYREDPDEPVRYQVSQRAPVVLEGIGFTALCEHHLLPFIGTVSVEYLPGPGVLGLSAIVREVERQAHRLQLQERFTQDVAEGVARLARARLVRVTVRAEHLCIAVRGVRREGVEVVTQALAGREAANPAALAELDRGRPPR